MITLHLKGSLGEKLNVAVEQEDQLVSTLQRYAKMGYSSGSLPTGGLVQALTAEETFPWGVIGARPYELKDKTLAVQYQGRHYRRRETQEDDVLSVAYSRGANRFDDPLAIVMDGVIRRVDLIRFVGRVRQQKKAA